MNSSGGSVGVSDGGDGGGVGGEAAVAALFHAHFQRPPTCVARAPGRVNLIGEHIDYNGYPVLPIAIEQSSLVAASPNDDGKLYIINTNSKYAPHTCDVTTGKLEVGIPPQWYDYIKSGIRGIQEKENLANLCGMNICVAGNIPPNAGLSSSSSLVCGAALATYRVQLQDMRKPDYEMATVCAQAEKFVGTQGGGMDQAASLLSVHGCAQLISFNPLRCDRVDLPSGATFVVANSMHMINKAATSDFNCRVMECKMACRLLAKATGLNWEEVPTLACLQNMLNKSLKEMEAVVLEHLHSDSYTPEEIAQKLEISKESLIDKLLTKNTSHIDKFQLRSRALHVFSEAERVYMFKKICEDWKRSNDSARSEGQDASAEASPADVNTNPKTHDAAAATAAFKERELRALQELGAVMNRSHDSARDDYECSHAALDELVRLSSKHAFGARLTGAGWGGCIVALVAETEVEAYTATLRDGFYRPRSVGAAEMQRLLFVSPPAAGATVHPPPPQ